MLEKQVGHGTYGRVYKAWDTKLERIVAIKQSRFTLSEEPKAGHRFLQEARSAAGLESPNIVRIYDVDDQDDLPYIVMEFVSSNLQKIMATGRISTLDAIIFTAGICRGLAVAHNKDIIHQDIKPGNILMAGARGVTPKVADFGTAIAYSENMSRNSLRCRNFRIYGS